MDTTTATMPPRSIGTFYRWLYFSIELLQSGAAAKTRHVAQDVVNHEDDERQLVSDEHWIHRRHLLHYFRQLPRLLFSGIEGHSVVFICSWSCRSNQKSVQ
jgi:hypothetical protein